MAANPREDRRRRILDRGSDRLALITGRIQSLPSSSESPPFYDESEDPSSQPLISNQQDLRSLVSDQLTVSRGKDTPVGSTSQHKDPQIGAGSTAYYRTSTVPLLRKSNEIETAADSTPENGGRAPPLVTPFEDRDSSLSTMGRDQCSKIYLKELSLAISESEKTRLCFSAIIACLVVASYVGFPFSGQSLMRIVFGSRPLYLLLLTNVTVVLGRLLFTKQKGFRVSDRGEGHVTPPERQSSVEQSAKVLGLVIQKAMDAIFMDCSVFAVIVVLGLSFVQRL